MMPKLHYFFFYSAFVVIVIIADIIDAFVVLESTTASFTTTTTTTTTGRNNNNNNNNNRPSSCILPRSSSSISVVVLNMSGLFGEQPKVSEKRKSRKTDWDIYVDQSKSSLDRGGSATLDAFCGLLSSSTTAVADSSGDSSEDNNYNYNNVNVIPAILPKYSKKKGPWIRCISNNNQSSNNNNSLDISNVDSVDKVYRVLTKHLNLKVSMETCECLKWKYRGNSHLESGKISLAIDAYNKSLEKCGSKANNNSKQEGIILLLRASAYLQQAQAQKQLLLDIVQEWELPDLDAIKALLSLAATGGVGVGGGGGGGGEPGTTSDDESSSVTTAAASIRSGGLGFSLLQKLKNDGISQQTELRKIQYLHGLYQYSLLKAAQDSLRSTELLPNYSNSWLRAGELLSELWKLKESKQYYEKALELDDSLRRNFNDIVDSLERRQILLDEARRSIKDWPEGDDSLRLALDIAA